MKFQFSRAQQSAVPDRPVEEETLQRWRVAATKDEFIPQMAEIKPSAKIKLTKTPQKQSSPVMNAAEPSNQQSAYQPKVIPSDSKLSVEDDLARRFGARIRAALGPGAVIQGKLSFESPVRIDGTLVGEVTSTSTLIVGEQGTVDARVEVGSLIVLGQVSGQVLAQDLVEVKAGGRLEADVDTKRLVVDEQGFLEGACNLGKYCSREEV